MNTQIQVLVVDDDRPFRTAMGKALKRRGFAVEAIASGAEAIAAFQQPAQTEAVRVAILDLRMPGIDGLEVLRATPDRALPVVVLSGHGGIPNVVEAMRLGAFTFMTKPVDAADLVPILEQAVRPRLELSEYLGDSPCARELRRLMPRMAQSREPLLLIGENGVGKALVASLMHRAAAGQPDTFVRISPGHFAEEDLDKRLEDLWNGGGQSHANGSGVGPPLTVYVDELTDLSLHLQERLVRWLGFEQDENVSGRLAQSSRPRWVLATRQNPLNSVRRGILDETLFYRLQVLPIGVSPLRDRMEDVLPIARSWLRRIGGEELTFTPCACDALMAHPWPGNARELVNLVRRVSLFGVGGAVDGPLVRRMLAANPFGYMAGSDSLGGTSLDPEIEEISLEALERRHIESLMVRHQNVSRVSRILQINRRTLQRKLRAWGMYHSDFEYLDSKS